MDQRRSDGHNTRQVNERKENVKSTYDNTTEGYTASQPRAPSDVCDCLRRGDERHEVNGCGGCGRCGPVEAVFLHCPMLSET